MNVRPATRDDLPAIAELFASLEEEVLGRPSRLVADEVEGWLQTTVLETNTWLLEEDALLLAGAFAELHGDRGDSAGGVRPSAWGRGLGTQLLQLVEARVVGEGAQRIHSWTLARDTRARELLSSHGYREVRRFWDMAIDLESEPPGPEVEVESFRTADAQLFHAALEEAFEDHWEPHPESFDRWWQRQRQRSNFDTSLWFLIRDGREVAAIARSEARESGGYVGSLGVRRRWRGRGYGRALLQHTFREFWRRGLRRVTLGVDAANPTGATRLYEGVGMHVDIENVVWEKVLA